ncbi:hypothetical protein BDW59DRAFT_179413 [Aspergillus cavernicola]|uniref:Uncharacterized protein n=1 Tax=Aspergillus cavernicola TaxID=176166 RepID=A0ABR4H6C4_9EURO
MQELSGATQMTLLIIIFSLLLGGILCLDEVTSPPLNNYIASQAGTWERTPSYPPTPGNFGRERTPSEYSFYPIGERSPPVAQSQPGQLRFVDNVDNVDSDNGPTDDEHPSYIPYIIEWRVTLNNRQIKQEAERVLRQKINRDRRVRLDDTTIVVSVNDRSQRDLTNRFEKTNIAWAAINKQILLWQDLLQQPKKMLTLSISINYIEDTNPPARKTDKRGASSIDAEGSSGQPSVWRDVYRKMRCPGPPCQHEGQYCWQDPGGKKHYKLRTHHLRTLVKYVEQGEHQRLSKQKSLNHNTAGTVLPPININVLPTQSSQPLVSSSWGAEAAPRTIQPDYIDIPGPIEAVVGDYANWHLSRVNSESYRENIRRARDIALDNCFDLGQISRENPEFFVKQGVKIGVARRFVSHTGIWRDQRDNGSV